MALINCPECGKEISSEAKACPNCGYGIKKVRFPKEVKTPKIHIPKKLFSKRNIVYLGIILSVCLVFGIWIFSNNMWESKNVTNCLTSGNIGCLFAHNWVDKDCENAKHCETCGLKDGEPAGHVWLDATCENAKYCEVCDKISGKALGHDYEITIIKDGVCLEEEEILKKCKRCDDEISEKYIVKHEWVSATCDKAKYCKSCKIEEGVALGHTTDNGTCSRCNQYIEKIYEAGEKWIVEGEWEFTVDSVSKHRLCNSFSNSSKNLSSTEDKVILITYSYKNLGYKGFLQDLYFSTPTFKVYDDEGYAVDTYACTHVEYPEVCVVGTACKGAQVSYVVPSDCEYILLCIDTYTTMNENHESDRVKATFKVYID